MPAFDKLRIGVAGHRLFVYGEPVFDPQAELHVRNDPENIGVVIQQALVITGVSAAGQAGTPFTRSAMTQLPAVFGIGETGTILISSGATSVLITSAVVAGEVGTLSTIASDSSFDRLLEDGSSWLLETGDHWEIEHLEYKLLEDGSAWLLESGDGWLTEHGISYVGPFLLMENGTYWLFQDGISRWKLENG